MEERWCKTGRTCFASSQQARDFFITVSAQGGIGSAAELCPSAIMAQPKQGLSLLKFIPKAMRPTTSDVSSVVLWGTTAACGALWLVQPFDWIKQQLSDAPKEEEN